MLLSWDIFQAMLYCPYKAWKLVKIEKESITQPQRLLFAGEQIKIVVPVGTLSETDKLILTAICQEQYGLSSQSSQPINISYSNGAGEASTIRIRPDSKKARRLFLDTQNIISKEDPPPFYRNAHCPECQFREACYKKLQERDCISLMSGMPPKVILKFHKKGVYTIKQLSQLFRPRRRRRHPQVPTNFLWELKALAIIEQKTFVLHPPGVADTPVSIFIDFEGLPDEGWIYLIGVVITQEGEEDKSVSFWADTKEEEKEIFNRLFDLLGAYADAPVYHYGSYEGRAFKQAIKKGLGSKDELMKLEQRTINLLIFLRTHVYPPIYSNGLKELAGFLGFKWHTEGSDGMQSVQWRKQWEVNQDRVLRQQLLTYNLDDCQALVLVKQWFQLLATNADQDNVKHVSEIKKQSPFKFQNNPELGTDFQLISKAAYFDYQRTKIYWRTNNISSAVAAAQQKPKGTKGVMIWQPKQVNERIVLAPLASCPRCGSSKVYHYKKKRKFVQTDLKFTTTGIKQHVVEYEGMRTKCGSCFIQYNDQNLRMLHYGDNVFAYATNLYVNYNISNYMVSKIILEQFGIGINPMYLVMRKGKWWKKWRPEIDYIWEIIRHSPVIHIDETSIHLDTKSGYVWVFATAHTVFYHYTDTREGYFLHDWLKDYKGVIVTDFFAAYDSIPVRRQKCLIHLIRDLNDDLYKNPFDEEFKKIVTGFNTLLRKIIETIDRYGLTIIHLQKHLKDVQVFFHNYVETEHKSELSIKCVKRFQKHWDQLWTFLQRDGVPWNNNNAEAAVKAFAQYRRGVKGQIGEQGLREYLQMLSIAQTCRYRNISFLSFLRGKAGLWQNVHPQMLPGYLPFNQARQYVHKLKFQRRAEWLTWAQSDKRPYFIPLIPDRVYKDTGWVDWANWVGFGFLPFEKARAYMRRLGLKNRDDYRVWLKSGKRPKTIPHEPQDIYKHTGWSGLGDWLGTGNTNNWNKKKLTYEQAKAYVQTLGIKTWQEYVNWSVSGERPDIIPAAPDKAYYEFKSWGEFLGTNRIANQNKEFWNYQQTKEYLRALNIRSKRHFDELCKNGTIPDEIPRDPRTYYNKYGDWIGYPDLWSK